MKSKKNFSMMRLIIGLFIFLATCQFVNAQTATGSMKMHLQNFKLSGDSKTISYDVYVQDIDPSKQCGIAGYTVRLQTPKASIGANNKIVTVTNANALMGAGNTSPVGTSGSNWVIKFSSTSLITSWAGSQIVSETFPGTMLATVNITNEDLSSFSNPQSFTALYSSGSINKSMLSLFLEGTNTPASDATTAIPFAQFTGLGSDQTTGVTFSLSAATAPTTASAPTITLSKAYDGTATAAVTKGTLSGVSAGDAANVTLNATAAYSDAAVGTAKTITVSYTLSGSAASKYSAPADYVVTTGVITKKALTIAAPTITTSKAYDGTNSAVVTAGSLSGVLAAESANVSVSATAAYNNATAGTGKTITVTYTLSGSDAGNYTAPVNSSVTTGVITALPLTASAPTITLSKAYDGTATAAVTKGTLSGVLAADAANVTLNATAAYATPAVGTGKTITVTYTLSGSAAANYTAPVSSSVTTGIITVKALTIAAPTITLSKTYDGTTTAAVTAGALTGVATADAANVIVSVTGVYDNETTGVGKTITVTYVLSGSAAGNYTAPASSSVTTGVITAKALTIAAPTITLSKAYDGAASASVTTGALSGVAAADAANVTVSATAVYATAAVGTGKTITVTYTLSGSAAGNYTAPVSSSVTTGVITALPLTVSAPTITLSKVYDGTATAAVTKGTLSGVLAADAANVTLTATAAYATAIAGTGKTITVTYTLSGSAAANYTAPVSSNVTTGIITAKALTIAAPTITLSKTYDGTTTAAVTAGALTGVAAADAANVTVSATGSYDNVNVGTGKTITVTYALSGSAAGNYTAPASSSVTTGVITAKALTIAAPTITLSKAYNGTASAAVTAGALSGVADAANVTVSATAAYNNANVGTGKTITVTYTLNGTAAGNYTAPVNSSVTTGVITALPLTVSAPTITLSKVYDGTISASATAGTLSGVLAADAANVTVSPTAVYDNKNIGTSKTITVTYTLSGSAAANYTAPVSSSVTTGVITVKALTISAPTITLSKPYDANVSAAVTAGTLSGVVAADAANVTVSATGSYDNANVGIGKTITVTYTLSGSAAANYTAPASTSVTTGVIEAGASNQLLISAPTITLSKVYNGTATATVTAGTLSNVQSADAANVTVSATAVYNNANVGTGKTITVTYTLSGSAAANYIAPANTVVTTGVITALPLTAAAPTITLSKVYDGTISASATAGTLSGVLSADAANVTLTATAAYATAAVGTGKTITVTYTLSGSAAANYTAPVNSSVTTGIITAKALTVSAPGITLSKVYDGTISAAVTAGTLSGVLAADAANVTLTATAAYDNATEGTGKTITVTYTLSGSAAANYTAPVSSSVTTGVITPAAAIQLTISNPTITLSKEYDGTTIAAVTAGTLSNVAPADVANVTLTATAAYNNANAGTGKTITVTYTLSGSAASKYIAPVSSSVTTGIVTAKSVTVSAPTITLSKVYDGTISASATAGTLSGVLSADAGNVTVSPTAVYDNKNIGTSKTITVTYTLSGSAAGNYTTPVSSNVTTGVITVKALTISAPTITLSKPYDANVSAAVTAGTLSGVVAADAANVTVSATGSYDNANVGTGKTITVTYTLSGSAAANYTAPASTSVTTGVIEAGAINQLLISAPTITLSKVYNGTATATVTAGTLSNVQSADAANVTVSATAVYNNANVGTGKTITVTYTLSGSAAANYIAPANTVVTTGVITALPLTATAPTITLSKVYDGTISAAVTAGTLSGVLAADAANVTLTATAAYDNATEGTGKTITVTYTLSGSAAANYTAPASSSVTTGVITPAAATQLTISNPTITLSKEYDGTTSAAVTAGTLSNVAPADAANVTLTATAVYNNATVGTSKTITVTYTLSGSAASKYIAPVSSSVTTGIVAAKALTVSAPNITLSKEYDGTTSAVVTAGTLSGVLAADVANVTLTATAVYDNATVGTAKTITVTYALSGSAAGNYTAPASTSVTTGVITQPSTIIKVLTVNAPTITLSKVYDGTTSAVVVVGTLTGVDPVDAGNVNVLATAVYDDATAGKGKAITVNYSLSGSAAAKYTIEPIQIFSNGEIIRKQLAVSNVTVATSKPADGSRLAIVSSVGSLHGLLPIDAGNVTLFTMANYNDANEGTNKTITVSYILGGVAKDNYLAPSDSVITNASITKSVYNIISLEPLADLTVECSSSNLVLPYKVLQGAPTKYQITFDANAHAEGVKDINYTALPVAGSEGNIEVVLPDSLEGGLYGGYLQVKDDAGNESVKYPFHFTVNVSSDYIVQIFNDVVTCDNKGNRFVAYQWYKNGIAINGATKQFYSETGGLNGLYSVRLATADGQVLYTCPKELTSTSAKGIKVYPNPVNANEPFTVEAAGFENKELEGATLSVYTTQGVCVYKSSKVDKQNLVSLALPCQMYIGHLTSKDGVDYVFKVIVNQ